MWARAALAAFQLLVGEIPAHGLSGHSEFGLRDCSVLQNDLCIRPENGERLAGLVLTVIGGGFVGDTSRQQNVAGIAGRLSGRIEQRWIPIYAPASFNDLP